MFICLNQTQKCDLHLLVILPSPLLFPHHSFYITLILMLKHCSQRLQVEQQKA